MCLELLIMSTGLHACMHAIWVAQQTSALWLQCVPSGCRYVQGFLHMLLALPEQEVHMCR